MFCASPTPTEIATPAVPAREAAIDAAPVKTSILEVSEAVRLMEEAFTPPLPSPSINALTFMPTVLVELAPAPPRLTPLLPAVTATDPARTNADIVCVAVARASIAPVARTVELER